MVSEKDAKLIDDMITYRAKNNLSQRKLAKECNVTLQTINQIEQGQQSPSNITRRKIRLVIGGTD